MNERRKGEEVERRGSEVGLPPTNHTRLGHFPCILHIWVHLNPLNHLGSKRGVAVNEG